MEIMNFIDNKMCVVLSEQLRAVARRHTAAGIGIGIPFITAYNIISSIFRGMGDSRSPVYFIAIACAANIALDYLLIGVLKLGPAGAALGTTLSQTISVIVSLAIILRRRTGLALKREHLRPRSASWVLC